MSFLVSLAISTVLSCAITAAGCTLFFRSFGTIDIPSLGTACVQPSVRREWRTLPRHEKDNYIKAVQCLGTKPSGFEANDTMYDDFPRVHKLTAFNAHKSAPFFPWHRYYIHSYEGALKKSCGYSGSLPYWDWSQDWNQFEIAPVWDAENGFGGNGVGELIVGDGACVTDGPFAGVKARYYDDSVQPHCLSRGFSTGEKLKELAELISPNAIAETLREEEFSDFTTKLEIRAHRFISESVNGDFSKYTGPYDPVFFLHHANLDRLWSKWQQMDALKRYSTYSGKASMYSDAPAQIDDMLDIGGLLEKVPVSSVMETTSEMLCYTYN